MTSHATALPPFPTRRAALRLTGVAGVGAVLAVVALLAAGRSEQLAPALGAAAMCLIAALASLDVLRRATAADLQRVVLAAMVAFPLRVALVGAGVTAAAVGAGWPGLPTILWTLLFYLVLLSVEVAIVVGYVRDATNPPADLLPAKGAPSHA